MRYNLRTFIVHCIIGSVIYIAARLVLHAMEHHAW